MVIQWIACIALQLCGTFFIAVGGDASGEDPQVSGVCFVIGGFLLAAGVAVRP